MVPGCRDGLVAQVPEGHRVISTIYHTSRLQRSSSLALHDNNNNNNNNDNSLGETVIDYTFWPSSSSENDFTPLIYDACTLVLS